MTLLWHICFSFGLAAPLAAATVSGTVAVTGGRASTADTRSGNSGVVLWLEPLEGKAPLPQANVSKMVQSDKQFQPHVLAIPVGTTVDFPNLDPIFHNAFSNIDGQPFDIGLYPPGTTRKVQFRRPGVVRVFCNIHQSMSAVIVVLDTPWMAVSDAKGRFSIGGVPPGNYRVHVFYERATRATLDALISTIKVEEGGLTLRKTEVSETGYIEVQHKDKYGRDYVSEDEAHPYGGGR
jgi:plastocyanin